MCKFMATFSQLILKISIRINEVSVGSFSQMSHILLNRLSVQYSQIVTFSFLHLSGTWHLFVYRFITEPYESFRRVFVEVLCHSFMIFAKVIFFPMKLFKKIYLHGKFIIEFIIEFLFSLSHMFPLMNKFLITENMCLSRLVKEERCRSSHCIFQSFKP